MKRFLALTLALLIVMTMAACGGSGGKAADPNTLVVWHDKEAAVIEALQAYLDRHCLISRYGLKRKPA